MSVLPQYTIHPNGGIIAETNTDNLFAPDIIVKTTSYRAIIVGQGDQRIAIAEDQLRWFLDAITRAAKFLKFEQY